VELFIMQNRRIAPGLLIAATLLAVVGAAATRPARAGQIAYAIGGGGSSLVRFSTDTPGTVSTLAFSGDATALDAIDFRPATGQLFGYNDANSAYYTVNLATGVLTRNSMIPVGATTNTFFLGMDFNPTIDRLRVVTESTQNLVYNPIAGTAAAFTPLFYASGDPNAAFTPLVIDNAYTNNIIGMGTTQQYVLDYDLNVLARLDNNAGTLTTVGKLTLGGLELDFDQYTGFDIFTDLAGNNLAYALLQVGGTSGLYSINLNTGAATSLGALGSTPGPIYGLAVTPTALVPEPSSIALAGLAASAFALRALLKRSRNRAAA
jgi:adhesin HecA-like repeat protein